MKIIIAILLPVIFKATIYDQVVTYDDFKAVITFLLTEDFKEAFEKTSHLPGETEMIPLTCAELFPV
ncbi:MAG: hypothetical protein ABI675_04810 [Chitinophagaceae bacterium]